ncbi:MAG TPA: DivIVA domain-containing protein, partial [Pseudomonas sp.]|uniref:DivIVA domain-containing protein n=1 Tax=Pseudomonas sp. TaxID=306 RepID=UPI002B492E52
MQLTPADVRHVTFNKPPVGRPGYHEDEVDDFLDLVEAELTKMIQENTELRAQVARLDQQLGAMPTDTTADPEVLRPGPETMPLRPLVTEQARLDTDHERRAGPMPVVAQDRADQLTDEARAKAEEILSQARTHGDQLLATAQDKAAILINEAHTRAQTLLQDARTSAQAWERQSHDKAASLEQEATRQRTEILDSLHRDKTRLETTIDELRAFELEY